MNCCCDQVENLDGADGQEYEVQHLRKITINKETWEVLLMCPARGILWKKYYPFGEAHGGGPPRYVKIARQAAEKSFDLETASE